MADLKVMTNELNAKIEELRSLNKQFKNEVNELENTEASLNGMWEGSARKAFHKEFKQDKSQMDTFHDTIEQYIQALQEMLEEYKKTEQKNIEKAQTRKYK